MKPVLIVFGTHGTTRRIAGRVATQLAIHQTPVEVMDAGAAPHDLALDGYAAVIVASSVHLGGHQPEVIAFARRHRAELQLLPSIFMCVSLSTAVADDPLSPPARRARAFASGLKAVARFIQLSGWQPQRVVPVAGALTYLAYPRILKQAVRMVAWWLGGPTDASRDHDLTDWKAVARVIDALIVELHPRPPTGSRPRLVEPLSASWN